MTERDALQFALQAPGIAPPAPGSRLSTQGNVGLNSSGAREASNNFLLDGVDNNDLFLNRLVVNPSLDAIEEVSLLQNTYDADYGRSAGAQVNIVLKSGTQQAARLGLRVLPPLGARRAQRLRARRPAAEPRCASTSSAARSAARSARWPSFYFVNVEASTRTRPTRGWRTCRPRPSAPATSARAA